MKKWVIVAMMMILVGAAGLVGEASRGTLFSIPEFAAHVQGHVTLDKNISQIIIKLPMGDVTMVGISRGDVVSYNGQFVENATSSTKAKSLVESRWHVQKVGNTLQMVYQPPSFSLHMGFDFQRSYLNLQVPANLLASINNVNGSVQVTSMKAGATVHTSNGSITMQNVRGEVICTTSNGVVTAQDIMGSANLKTSNGRIQFGQVTGNLQARVSNGKIRGSSAVGGNWDLETSNGEISVDISRKSSATIEAGTSSGGIHGEIPWVMSGSTSGHATISGGAHPVGLHTSNGEITVNYS